MEFLEVGEGNDARKVKIKNKQKMSSPNLFDRLSGNEKKIRVNMALYYWNVSKERVKGCDPNIPQTKNIVSRWPVSVGVTSTKLTY